ncbi:putative RNA methyltransferase [Sciscionella marina]|uniref:putative RNA methyltransferase n=1 Tax=Sciscionella marina TaxID=508770 RepID=UPI0003800C6A|nr:methyltransferase domain-containing protein [Sciscionella marina]
MSRLSLVERWLRCPVCSGAITVGDSVRCAEGHSFDIARQGYVNLRAGAAKPPRNADTAEMVAARARFLGAGHYAPLQHRLAGLAGTAGLVLDAGSGSGEYLSAVLDGAPDARGLALDLSAPAIRRAAKAHPRAAAVVADLRGRLPLADGAATVLLNVFSPRHAEEYRRVLAADGLLLAVTPGPGHLGELVQRLGLITVAPDKPERLRRALGTAFTETARERLRIELTLDHAAVADLVLMGPSAHHVDPERLRADIAALPEPVGVTASFVVTSATRLG